jgi:hypothetical protein
MIQRNDGARFLFKALEADWISREAQGQKLERSLAPRDKVFGEIHLTHAARANLFEQLVVAELLSNH